MGNTTFAEKGMYTALWSQSIFIPEEKNKIEGDMS